MKSLEISKFIIPLQCVSIVIHYVWWLNFNEMNDYD